MSVLGACLIACLIAAPAGVFAQEAQTPSKVRRLASSGALSLALANIEVSQPKSPAEAGWFEWERLRLDILESRGQHRAILDRVRTYPQDWATNSGAFVLLLPTTAAALQMGDTKQALRWLQRFFAGIPVDTERFDGSQYRRARNLTIQALLGVRDADAAYRAMLRYQQDFGPLTAEQAETFVAGLLRLGKPSEAANWLSQLGQGSFYTEILRLRAGLISSDAAMLRARAALAKSPDLAAIALLEAAGRARSDDSIVVEAMELRVNLAGRAAGVSQGSAEHGATALWEMYEKVALQAANRAQLLVGDDPAWLAYVSRAKGALLGRAVLAHLATTAKTPQLRADARAQLVASLRDARLGSTAVALFSDATGFQPQALDSRLRYLLGEISAEIGYSERAWAFWQGLSAPSGLTQEEWQLRKLSLSIELDRSADLRSITSELLEGSRPLTAESRKRMLHIALGAVDRGRYSMAEEVLLRLRSRLSEADRFSVLNALGRCHEAAGRNREAAAVYLDAALASTAPTSDPAALQARESAVRSLLRGGLYEDARAVLDWLRRNADDAAVRASAGRRIEALGPNFMPSQNR